MMLMDDFDLHTVCFYWLLVSPSCHFRWRHPSSLPMRGIWEHFGGAASVRGVIQHPVFSNLWPPMRGDWGAVWGSRTHKLTSCTYGSSYECVCSLPHGSREFLWPYMGIVTSIWSHDLYAWFWLVPKNFAALWLAVAWSSPIYYSNLLFLFL